MFTDVHLMAAIFCAKEYTNYALNKLRLTKDGRAIASDAIQAIIVSPFPDKPTDAKEDMYIEKEDALRILKVLKPTKRDKDIPITTFDIEEVDGKEYKIIQSAHGLTVYLTHDQENKFPDVELAVENVNPKKKEGCQSVYVNLGFLKGIIDRLCEMTGDGRSVEMFFAGQAEGKKAALRLEIKGKNDEKIEVTLMQMTKE